MNFAKLGRDESASAMSFRLFEIAIPSTSSRHRAQFRTIGRRTSNSNPVGVVPEPHRQGSSRKRYIPGQFCLWYRVLENDLPDQSKGTKKIIRRKTSRLFQRLMLA
jgi:hypothetical protein